MAPAAPLHVHPDNPLYFQTADGKPVVLIGEYTWGTFSDMDYDYKAMFDALKANGLNFARVWLWWGAAEFPKPIDRRYVIPYERPGPGRSQDGQPRYDLTRFNPAFFQRLRSLCAAAQERGVYLQLILFDAWMLKHPHLWKLHAYHRENNINDVDGDARNTGTGTDGQQGFCSLDNPKALEAQQEFIRRVVDTVNEFDHILFEIANENYYNREWELRLCDFIHDYEKTKAKQHLVMPKDLLNHSNVVQTWDIGTVHTMLIEKRRLRQPLIFDTDWTITQNDDEVRRAAWTAVFSGGHFNYMDDSFQIGNEHKGDFRGTRRAALHRQVGYLASFMRQMRFWEMQADDALVKEGNAFAMASAKELAAYLPAGGSVTLDISRLAGQLEARWFDPLAGTWGEKFAVQGGKPEKFTAPSANDWGLFLRNYTDSVAPGAPMHVQTTALAPSSIRVTWTAATENTGEAGYKVFRDGAAVATTVLPSHTDFGLAPETRYAYAVAAFDLAGNCSPMSTPPAQVTTQARAPFCQVDLGAEDKGERLKHVTDPDGDTRPAKAGGKDCREPASTQDHYFYFGVDDGYLHNEAGLATRLEVSYFDASGFIKPQFDSVTGAYTSAKPIDLTGTGEWRTAAWCLARCRFANRQNAGADFRLFVGPNQVKVASVKLSPLAEHADAFGVHPLFPRHFVYRGQPFFFVGKSAFPLVDAEDWRGFVDEAHRDGFTVLRIWLCCPALTKKHGDDHFRRNQATGDLWPFGGTPAQPDFARFNQDYFRRLDAILDHMESKGMVAQLTLFAGGDFWPGGPYAWNAVKQRYVQFVLDRYRGRPNLYYEIANEYYSPEGQAFVEKVGDFIWESDKHHLVTASAGEPARFVDKPWYRLHHVHASRGRNWWRRVYDELLPLATRHRLPVVNDEPMGSQAPDDKEQGYPGRDTDPAHHRMNFWMTAMSGSHVTFHSHKGINALVGPSPGQEFVRPFREFFERTRFWALEPAPEKVHAGTAYALVSATESVVYLPEGGAVTLDLSGFKGPSNARWFNPRSEEFSEPFQLEGGTILDFTAPDKSDWVLHLKKVGRL